MYTTTRQHVCHSMGRCAEAAHGDNGCPLTPLLVWGRQVRGVCPLLGLCYVTSLVWSCLGGIVLGFLTWGSCLGGLRFGGLRLGVLAWGSSVFALGSSLGGFHKIN